MTRAVRFTGRFMNADEETVDLVCQVASAAVVQSRRDVGAGGDVQVSISPTAIVLYEVDPESMDILRKGTWTPVEWSGVDGGPAPDRQIRQIFIEGTNVRVLV